MNSEIQALGYFSSNRFNLKEIALEPSFGAIEKSEKGYVLFKISKSEYLYIKDFGGLAFLGVEKAKVSSILNLLQTKYQAVVAQESDSLIIHEKGIDQQKKTEGLCVLIMNIDIVHIVALNLAQSATLFYYQSLSDKLLEETRVHTNELESKGKVSLRKKELLKYIGSTLNIKNKIVENLYVFESPMLAYENAELSKIDSLLLEDLEIKMRYNGIKEQLNIVHENLDLFKDISLHQHSSNLEWIIIVLILFEVIHVIIENI